MKQIFLSIQKELEKITELKHIDKNWGQLLYEQPPVKFPCALLDLEKADYTQLGNLAQKATGIVEITIANFRLTNSSGKAPRKEEAYAVMDIIEKIHQLLHGWSDGETFQRLIRINVQKLDASYAYEIYKISFQTAWEVRKKTNLIPLEKKPNIVITAQ
jgi:hypothetical protein